MAPTTGPSPPRYRVVKIAGRPIIATPDQSLRLRLAGLAQYRPVTKKRACLRAALRLCAITGIDRLFTRSEATPVVQSDGFDFEQMLDEIRGALGAPSSLATIIWPQLIERRRLYAHLMSTSGTPVAFCKIALNADNADRLKNELDTIRELGKRSLIAARLPRILHHLATGDRR